MSEPSFISTGRLEQQAVVVSCQVFHFSLVGIQEDN